MEGILSTAEMEESVSDWFLNREANPLYLSSD